MIAPAAPAHTCLFTPFSVHAVQVKLGDRDVDLLCIKDADGINTTDPAFRVYMQTKLPNPHYIPEIQAQTTLVNFTVTEKGLEDQLLARVVGKERPDLLQEQSELVSQQVTILGR